MKQSKPCTKNIFSKALTQSKKIKNGRKNPKAVKKWAKLMIKALDNG